MLHKTLKGVAVASLMAFGVAGCTNDQIAQTLNGINLACTAAGVAGNIAVVVTSSLGGKAAVIGGVAGTGVSKGCDIISAAAQAEINAITAAGGTATVTVETKTASGARTRRKAMVWRDKVTGETQVYVVTPGPRIPFLGNLGGLL